MKDQEAIYLGCVMGWESDPHANGQQEFDLSTPAVLEFCPGALRAGRIEPTGRMLELAVAGFKPIGIVSRDNENADRYLISAHGSASDRFRRQLLSDADAIVKAAAGCAESSSEARHG